MGGYQVRLRPAADRFIVSRPLISVELEDPFVLPRRSPSWAVPGAASCHLVRLLCPLYYFMCSGHIICVYLVFSFRLTTDPQPPAVSTDVVFGGGWTCQ